MRRGSSNNPRGKFSRSGGRGTSRISPSRISRPGHRGSSNPSRFSRGGVYVPPIPVLLSGPDATPGLTTCNIAWELDPSGASGYHRIRWKANLGDDWIVEAFTDPPASHSASIDMSGLDPEHESYWVEVQSCSAGDGSAAFDWAAIDPAYFSTLCSGNYGMANWNVSKGGSGKLTYLILQWTTTVDMYYAQVDSSTSPILDASWASPDKTHYREYVEWDFSKNGTFDWRTRNRNKCYVWCDYSAWKYFVIEDGEVGNQW